LAAAFTLLPGVIACGGTERMSASSRQASAAPASAVCPPAPRRLAAALRHGIRHGKKLRRLFAVRSGASFTGKAPEVRGGVYFASGDVGAAVATWAVSTRAWQTGAGWIATVDAQARALSPPRWLVHPRRLERRFGISPSTDGYARARACANPTRA